MMAQYALQSAHADSCTPRRTRRCTRQRTPRFVNIFSAAHAESAFHAQNPRKLAFCNFAFPGVEADGLPEVNLSFIHEFYQKEENQRVQVCKTEITEELGCAPACAVRVRRRVRGASAGTSPLAAQGTWKGSSAEFFNRCMKLLCLPPAVCDPALMAALLCGSFAFAKLLLILAVPCLAAAVLASAKAMPRTGAATAAVAVGGAS